MSEQHTEFGLSTDSYAAFDATSLKALIKNRLTDKGVFTDHLYEGSNLSSIIDVIAYSYHTLLFYLNRTSSEAIFTEAQLYENINRIVKLLNYNPSGYKTSVVSVNAKTTLPPGSYTIPRYSFIDVGGIKYSTNQDITFGKIQPGLEEETIRSIAEDHLLYQGSFEEYPIQVAVGEDFETFTLVLGGDIKADTFNVHVFVQEAGSTVWREYNLTESLFLENTTSPAFEKRLNENRHFEIRFGNNTYGRKLNAGDRVAIYYIRSDQDKGKIGADTINGHLTPLTTKTFLDIRQSIKSENTIYMSVNDLQLLKLTNSDPSTDPEQEESEATVKTYAPSFFGSQNRLITANDFKNYIDKEFSNLVLSTSVVSNNEYIDSHLAYAVNTLGLQKPSLESRLLYNQVMFASSTNYNNVYIYAVPRFEKITSATPLVHFLTPSQRSFIVNSLERLKVISSNPVIIDPVYMAVDIGAAYPAETLHPDIRIKSKLNIVKRRGSQRDNDTIASEVVDVINSYFGTKSRLGYLLDMNSLYNDIANIKDVEDIYMTRDDNPSLKVQGITFLNWHPAYDQKDIEVVSQNKQYPFFKFPYLYDPGTLRAKINVTVSSTYSS